MIFYASKRQKALAWIKKYIFRIESPSAALHGIKYEWDMIKANERGGQT